MVKDINKEPYDKATLAKLDIFEQYFIAWLPVFIYTPQIKKVTICDYFAGSGQDSEGLPGSPLRILKVINTFRVDILKKEFVIDVVLNEARPNKSSELKKVVDNYFNKNGCVNTVTVSYPNKEFQCLFHEQYDQLQKQPNLLFIDQYGIKEVNSEIFQMLINLKKTDFLFFLSSSFIKRFIKMPEFKNHFPEIDIDKVKALKYTDMHRFMVEHYKKLVPPNNDTKLYPYSLLKGSNIYGLVFGSKHPLGVQKFLELAWNKYGPANFDIYNDKEKQLPHLFDSLQGYEREKPKKEIYETELKNFILSKDEVTNREVWEFTLNMGHPKSHAKNCIAKLRKSNIIECDAQIGFSYETCIKNKKLKIIKAKRNG